MPTPKKGYYLDGEKLPSVTQVLGLAAFVPTDALCTWASKLAREGKDWREERNRAGMVGTAIHDAIEGYPNLPREDDRLTDEEVLRRMNAWEAHGDWVARHRPKVLLQELQLISPSLRVGGTPDLILKLDDTPVITDHKSSKQVDAKAVAQVGTYAFMVQEVTGVEVQGGIIFHHPPPDSFHGRRYIRETGKAFRAIPLTKDDLAAGLAAFRLLRPLYDLVPRLKGVIEPTETLR